MRPGRSVGRIVRGCSGQGRVSALLRIAGCVAKAFGIRAASRVRKPSDVARNMSGGLFRRKISLSCVLSLPLGKGEQTDLLQGCAVGRKLKRQDAALFPVAEGAQNVLFRMIKAVCHVRNADRIACLQTAYEKKIHL